MFRFILALGAAKFILLISKLLGPGRGSSLPGLWALRIAPDFLQRFARQPRRDTIMVIGTNGKTTTSNMLAQIFTAAGYKIITNGQGANLSAGIATVFARHSTIWSGKVDCDYAILEVDEAVFATVTKAIQPGIVVVTNFFPDQPDRYGSQQNIINNISNALAKLPRETMLILNGDDPQVAYLARASKLAGKFYGLQLNDNAPKEMPHQLPVTFCPNCADILQYQEIFYGHLGVYSCAGCDFARTMPDVFTSDAANTDTHIQAVFSHDNHNWPVQVPVPGWHNLYNALAAYATGYLLGINPCLIQQGLLAYIPAMGRTEYFNHKQQRITLVLVKNAMGLNQALANLSFTSFDQQIVVAINSEPADGRDVSWLWDVDMEILAGQPTLFTSFVCSGHRAADVALRLKYAGVDPNMLLVQPDLKQAVQLSLASGAEIVTMLVNYSALAPVEKQLTQKAERVNPDEHHHVSSVS